MEEKKVTVEDVIQDAVKSLNNIQLPVAWKALAEELFRIAANLQTCIEAFHKEEVSDDVQSGRDEN